MKPFRYYIFLFILCFSCPFLSKATHIVGGEMNYTCLGNNEYEITLVIFRDCYNGNPNAFFDDPASIGVFDADNNLLEQILIPWDEMLNDTLDPVLSSECFVVPPDVCVHTTTYTTVIPLQPRAGGYQLAYQRCCRNVTIKNIVEPLATGATYGVTISERALEECNSNPKFNDWPPIYICVNEPISFDQSAFDIDGDSIVYKLCTPLQGANPDEPMPQPPNDPPYDEIVWVDPPYNVDNMLNGTPGSAPLNIDLNTGLLTGFPNTQGQFVVGICVEEYRNGELISTTRRDFQYNVGVCGQPVTSFLAPDVQCDDLTVSFENLSENTQNYVWFFDYPNNPGATSTNIHPFYTYSNYGTYDVMLISDPGEVCSDTFFHTITLEESGLTADFDYEVVECSDSLLIQVSDLSVDNISTVTSWLWEIVGTDLSSTEQNPTFVLTTNGLAALQLTVTSENGCSETLFQQFTVNLLDAELRADTVQICSGSEIDLNPNANPDYQYQWSPTEGLDDPTAANPIANPNTTTTYTVTISDGEDCEIQRMITVTVPPILVVDVPEDMTTCDPDVSLTASSNIGLNYTWATDADFENIIAQEATVVVTPFGESTYYVQVSDAIGCTVVEEVTIIGNGVNVDLDSLVIICDGDTATLSVSNNDPNDVLSYDWSPDEAILSGDGTPTPVVRPTEVGQTTFFVNITNELCDLVDSTVVAVIDTSSQANLVFDTQCSGFSVQFSSTSVNAPFFLWHVGDPTQPDATVTGTNPSYTYPATGTYNVMVTLADEVPCPDTFFMEVQVDAPLIDLAFDVTYETCADTAVIALTDLSTNQQSSITDWQWFFSNNETSEQQNPSVTIDESQTLGITLVTYSDDGCVDSLYQEIDLQVIEVDLQDTIFVCNGEPTPLNPNFNPAYVYAWSPATGLDDPSSPNPLANPSQALTYSVTISDFSQDTCQLIQEVQVILPPPIEVNATEDMTICEADIDLFAESGQAISYLWSENDDFSAPISNTAEVTVSPQGETTYFVQVSDEFGCQLVDAVTIFGANINVELPEVLNVCVNSTTQLELINLSPEQELTFSWSPATAILSGANTATPTINPGSDQTYSVDISNQFGCELTASTNVVVTNFTPSLNISATPDTIRELGESAQLVATLDPSYTYTWEADPTLSATDIFNPLATPLETTLYTLNISDANGCVNESSILIVVSNALCEEPFIFIPKGFTPNQDGKNDLLFVRSNVIAEIYFAVYNRWGQKVFETNNPSEGWDGTFDGKALQPGVFGYYVRARCFDGEEFFKKGNVTLLR